MKNNTKKDETILIIVISIIVLIISIYYIISTSKTNEYYEYYSTYYDLMKLTESDKGKKINCSGIVTEESNTTFYISSIQGNYNFDIIKKTIHVTYNNTNLETNLLIYDNSSISINGIYNYTDENGIIHITANKIEKVK